MMTPIGLQKFAMPITVQNRMSRLETKLSNCIWQKIFMVLSCVPDVHSNFLKLTAQQQDKLSPEKLQNYAFQAIEAEMDQLILLENIFGSLHQQHLGKFNTYLAPQSEMSSCIFLFLKWNVCVLILVFRIDFYFSWIDS